MNNIKDLHFQKEILPLFDFVNNDYSRDTLIHLLSRIPDSYEEILLRQNVIKVLIKNEQLFQPFFYDKSLFNDVYNYPRNRAGLDLEMGDSMLRINFLISRKKTDSERGRLAQLYIFLYKVHCSYFTHLKEELFPDPFKINIISIKKMLSDLDVEKWYPIIRERSFTSGDLVKLVRKLDDKNKSGELNEFWNNFFLFEAYLSIAKGIIKNKFQFPEFIETGLSIKGFYHPLIKDPIKNDFTVHKNVTLITGPNMAGKSTMLKAIGLCVYLAHLGVGVPAEKCELMFFDVISVAINLNDDIQSGYSHFMTEIKNVKSVVIEARNSKKCFALFDELYRGTNVEDALAISLTTINGLKHFKNSIFFISSHLQQLKEALDEESISPHFVECKLINNQPVFTYKLCEGWTNLKIGQILFEKEGLNDLLSF